MKPKLTSENLIGKLALRLGSVLLPKSLSVSGGTDVVIHIGAPKTGSSAIQRFCMRNRKALHLVGYHYPKHSIDKNGVSGGHSNIGDLLKKGHFREALLRFKTMLWIARLKGKVLFLSSESFYRNAREFTPLLQGLNVRVIGWFRNPVESLVSNYNQSVKRHFRTGNIGEMLDERFLKNNAANVNGRRLRQWGDVVGDEHCTFLPYLTERGASSYSAVGEEATIERMLLKVLNVDSEKFGLFAFDDKRVNRSYVGEALELKRMLNRVLNADEQDLANRVDWALQDYSDGVVGSSLGASLTSDEVQQLNQRFSQSSSILVRRFPSLRPVLKQGADCLHGADALEKSTLDFLKPLHHLHELYPEEYRIIQDKVSERLRIDGAPPEELIMLSELLKRCKGKMEVQE